MGVGCDSGTEKASERSEPDLLHDARVSDFLCFSSAPSSLVTQPPTFRSIPLIRVKSMWPAVERHLIVVARPHTKYFAI